MSHAHARTTFQGRLLIVRRHQAGWPQAHIAKAMGIARRTVKKWLDRYNAEGPAGLLDRSSRPHTGPTRTAPRTEQLIVATRRRERRGLTDIDTTQAITFYRTERGRSEHSTNRRLSRGDSPLLGYDAFHLVDRLMPSRCSGSSCRTRSM
ncbi:leucine zipper domain-containing protein [Amycolatopsis acididurans]|uniref:leucine zipper domain-containing protein n=1 Tax=Amycolatopsis acididurans TaxID=2724524 RepID=UPI001B320222